MLLSPITGRRRRFTSAWQRDGDDHKSTTSSLIGVLRSPLAKAHFLAQDYSGPKLSSRYAQPSEPEADQVRQDSLQRAQYFILSNLPGRP